MNILERLLYKDRKKVITAEMLSKIKHPVALACLICDDGSWDRAGISIASKQFTFEENQLLASFLSEQFGLQTGICTGRYTNIRITAASVAKARSLCFDFVPAFLRYKFGPDDYKTMLVGKKQISCPRCGQTFFDYESIGRKFCSRECSNKGRPCGYATRSATKACECCGTHFTVYNKKQRFCVQCR